MNRLFIIIAAIAGITGVAWALRHPGPAQTVATPAGAGREVPVCCQKSPSRASLLQAKPAAATAH
jgi:hypothetical protein